MDPEEIIADKIRFADEYLNEWMYSDNVLQKTEVIDGKDNNTRRF
ncbi:MULTISPECIES: hypothetical protein [Paenibacillus]|nr:hypothetical protein [Paenibacillus rhizosphaerae]